MTVFKLLVERYGIDPVRLQPVGKGSMELMDAGNPEGAANRRVQFKITEKKPKDLAQPGPQPAPQPAQPQPAQPQPQPKK